MALAAAALALCLARQRRRNRPTARPMRNTPTTGSPTRRTCRCSCSTTIPAWSGSPRNSASRSSSPARPTSTFRAYIAAVDQVCAQKPDGVIVSGGWDPSLTESVKRCMEQGVPTVVDDGDLPDSGRLAYIGTIWTQVGVAQAKKMMEALPNGGKLGLMSIINAGNMREGVAGFKAYHRGQWRRQIRDRRQRGRRRRRAEGGAGDGSHPRRAIPTSPALPVSIRNPAPASSRRCAKPARTPATSR